MKYVVAASGACGRADPTPFKVEQTDNPRKYVREYLGRVPPHWKLSLHIFQKGAEVVLFRRLHRYSYVVIHEKQEKAIEVLEYFIKEYEPARWAELQALEATVEEANPSE
jgi:hypothetical protein